MQEKDLEDFITEKKFDLILGVSKKLQINKNWIDFIENYSHESNSRKSVIDYYSMTTLGKMINECERFACLEK